MNPTAYIISILLSSLIPSFPSSVLADPKWVQSTQPPSVEILKTEEYTSTYQSRPAVRYSLKYSPPRQEPPPGNDALNFFVVGDPSARSTDCPSWKEFGSYSDSGNIQCGYKEKAAPWVESLQENFRKHGQYFEVYTKEDTDTKLNSLNSSLNNFQTLANTRGNELQKIVTKNFDEIPAKIVQTEEFQGIIQQLKKELMDELHQKIKDLK